MAAKLNKWQIALSVFGILALVTIAVIIVPLVVLNNVKTDGVAKQKNLYIYDDISGEKVAIPMTSYGYEPQHNSDKYYIERQIFNLAQDITDKMSEYKVEVVGSVIYIYQPQTKYFFIRKLGKEMVEKQGFEYRTSNSAKLLVKEGKVQQSTIYIPYHLMDVTEESVESGKILGGYIEQDLEYKTIVSFQKVLEFYLAYPFFEVEVLGETATINCKDITFTITNKGDYMVSYSVLQNQITLPKR